LKKGDKGGFQAVNADGRGIRGLGEANNVWRFGNKNAGPKGRRKRWRHVREKLFYKIDDRLVDHLPG
jgi:hypothetical protein